MTKSTGKRRFSPKAAPILDRLEAKTRPTLMPGMETYCLEWYGLKDDQGYGSIHYLGRGYKVHQVAWLLRYGALPPAPRVIDHRCKLRSCWNVLHLRNWTQTENALDGTSPNMQTYRSGICKRGHRVEGDNAYVHQGRRRCRTCRNEKAMEFYRRRKIYTQTP